MARKRTSCVEVLDDGGDRLLYRVTVPPAALPPVPVHDLEAALDDMSRPGLARAGRPRSFRFFGADGAIADFHLEDRDARAWAAAIDQRSGLATLGGLSLCLRLLALVDLLATAPWASRYLFRTPGRLRLDRPLLRAAARTDLTEEARFDEASFRRNLPDRRSAPRGAEAFTGVSS